MKFKLPWSYWVKKENKEKPARPILETEVTYEEELTVEIALRVVMKNAPETENVGDLLSMLAKENFRLNKIIDQVANYAESLEEEIDTILPTSDTSHPYPRNKHTP